MSSVKRSKDIFMRESSAGSTPLKREGSMSRLDQMADHSAARKKGSRDSPASRVGIRVLFDIIDARVARVIEKSTRIKTKLDVLVSQSRSPPYLRRSPSLIPRIRSAPRQSLDRNILRFLIKAVFALSTEIADLRQEQAIMSAQVNELHRAVFSDEI
jgi:hypothetical protein